MRINIGNAVDLSEDQLAICELYDSCNIDLQYNQAEVNNNEPFDVELIKKWIEKIKKVDPKNEFKYKFSYVLQDDYIIDSQECKELEKIDEYLRKIHDKELFIQEKNDHTKSFGFRRVISANRKLDDVVDKIKNATNDGESLSPFEKFMIVYEYVTQYVYTQSNDYNESSHWVPVLTGDKIVCAGYSSLLKALCDRIFSSDEVLVLQESVDLYYKNGGYYDGHSLNIVFIKDDKYEIDGLFYVDSTFDSVRETNKNKAQAYCCLPLSDILYEKKYDVVFHNSIAHIYLSQFKEYRNDSKKFFDHEKDLASQIEAYIFNNIERHRNLIEILGLIEYDSQSPSKSEDSDKAKMKNAQKVKNFFDEKCHCSISINAFANSYKIIGKLKGLKGEKLKKYVVNRLKESTYKTIKNFEVEQCDGCFAKAGLEVKKTIKNKH